MTDEEREAINNFQYFDKDTIITDTLINDKNIIMDLIARLQRENEELRDELNPFPKKLKSKPIPWSWWEKPQYEWHPWNITSGCEQEKHPIWSKTDITL